MSIANLCTIEFYMFDKIPYCFIVNFKNFHYAKLPLCRARIQFLPQGKQMLMNNYKLKIVAIPIKAIM
ncbi:hypothetical protein, partial [Anaerosolibacter sp.]|uniref:hypothetical protein n=1 Tax=Anaerosolibacter sp. TaxID=1872527 RepID=UPI0039EE5A47